MEHIEKAFEKIGIRAKIACSQERLGVDIGHDKRGAFFDIRGDFDDIHVLNMDKADHHLLLLVKKDGENDRFLCGLDERDWFVAAVPGGAITVHDAKESLKPTDAAHAQVQFKVKRKNRNKRRNKGFIRQGEWFFIPSPNAVSEGAVVHKNEPLSRGWGSKPHMVDELHRRGGEAVWVCRRFPNGIPEKEYQRILKENVEAKRWNWLQMMANPRVFARGRVRHPDHKTVVLHDWHEVQMNRENQSRSAQSIVFLD